MTARLSDITGWLKEAKQNNATHVIIAVDKFDHENYPVYVTSDKNIAEEIKLVEGSHLQGVDEVYNMSISIEEQLLEHRAYHI